ncbi:hypothetical protein CK203_103867 [Vitis vinifera]|uniref:Uncharacterized protein n=1 Tax=Vitis vinifera TaxID=29760 RepID=A0A438C6M3_VITVI|nr:hypothetical protein CK203_103867 [Vitis vinifera]
MECPSSTIQVSLRLGAGAALAFGSLLPEVLQLQFGALELALEAPELFPWGAGEWYTGNGIGVASGEGIGEGTGDDSGICNRSQPWFSSSMADPPDLVKYHLAGGFGGAGFTEGGFGLDGEGFGAGSGTEPGLGSFCRLLLRFEGDEDFAPRVRAILGYRSLVGAAKQRRRPEKRTAWLGEEDEGAARMVL